MRQINKRFLVILFFILVCKIISVSAKQFDNAAFKNYPHPSEINTDHTDGTWGEENNGLIAKIWTEKNEFAIGKPIVVHYIVKNISDKEIITGHSGFWPNHLIVVSMPDGSKISSHDLGLIFHPGVYDKNVPWPIKPGEIDNALSSYDISKFFDMNKPGMYSVQYLYEEEFEESRKGPLRSNVLYIKLYTKRLI